MKILMFLVGLFNLIDFNPEPVIAEVGLGDNSILVLENCIIISNLVDWNYVGDYEVTYFHNKLKKQFKRMIYIIEPEFNNIGFTESFINHDREYKVHQVEEDSEGYYLCGEIPSNDRFQWTLLPQSYGFISYFKDKSLVWEISFENEYSYVSSIVLIADKLFALLTIEEGNEESKLKLLEIENGIIKRQTILVDDCEVFGEQMVYVSDRLYVHCATDSVKGNLTFLDECIYIGIMEIDLDSFEVINTLCFGNPGENHIVDFDYDNNTISSLVFINSNGKPGQFENFGGKYVGNFIVVYSLDLKLIDYRFVHELTVRAYFMTSSEYVVIVGDHNTKGNSWIKIMAYLRIANFRRDYQWNLPFYGENIYLYDAFKTKTDKGNVFLGFNMFDIDNGNVEFVGVLEFIDNDILDLAAFYPAIVSEYRIDYLYFDKVGRILLSGRDNGKLIINDFIGLRKRNYQEYVSNNISYYITGVYVNGHNLGFVGNSEDNEFGHHEDLFDVTDIAKVLITNKYYTPKKINVKNNCIYDSGIKLKFNGSGYLNGEIIDNNTTIDQKGDYSLVVHGVLGEREIINFKVDNISLVGKDIPINKVEIGSPIFSINSGSDIEISFENFITKNDESFGIVITFLIAISFVLIALFKSPFRRNKK